MKFEDKINHRQVSGISGYPNRPITRFIRDVYTEDHRKIAIGFPVKEIICLCLNIQRAQWIMQVS